MLPKPESCLGCPLYGDGQGFTPDLIVEGSALVVLAQNPGADEEAGRRLTQYIGKDKLYAPCTPQPLIGATGYALRREYLPRTGLRQEAVSFANVLKCRDLHGHTRTNDMPKGERLKAAVEHCTTAHLHLPASARLVLALGTYAWEFTQGWGLALKAWRGYLGPATLGETPVMATVHTASLFRSPKYKRAAKSDWERVGHYLRGLWPSAMPGLSLWTPGTPLSELEYAAYSGTLIALDTEFNWSPEHVPGFHNLWVLGLAWRRPDKSITGLQIDTRLGAEHMEAARFVCDILVKQNARVLCQNLAADLPVLEHNLQIPRDAWANVEDLMLLHFMLYAEEPHDLAYLMSIYGMLGKTKHLASVDLLSYNAGDCIETLVAFEKLEVEGRRDQAVWWLYREHMLPLVAIHTRITQDGIAINKPFVREAFEREVAKMQGAVDMAQAYCGLPLNIGSQGEGQVASFLYAYLGMPPQRDRLTKKLSVDADAVGVLRQKVGPAFDPEEEDREGLTVEAALQRCARGANPLLEARVIYTHALQTLSHYIVPLVVGHA